MALKLIKPLHNRRRARPFGPRGLARTLRLRHLLLTGEGAQYFGEELSKAPLFAKSRDEYHDEVAFAFRPELLMYMDAPGATPEQFAASLQAHSSKHCLSVRYFGTKVPEVDRLFSSFTAIYDLVTGSYSEFVAHQLLRPLSERNFFSYRSQMLQIAHSSAGIWEIFILLAVSDLGKSGFLCRIMNGQAHEKDHDTLLFDAAKANKLEILHEISKDTKTTFLRVLQLCKSFSMSQLVQGENSAGSLRNIKSSVAGDVHAVQLAVLKTDLDVMGAAGHIEARGSLLWNQDLHRLHAEAKHSMLACLQGASHTTAYRAVLQKRLDILYEAGWTLQLDLDRDEDYAIARLLSMGRVATSAKADAFREAFISLDIPMANGCKESSYKEELQKGLCPNRIEDFVLYYGPATLANLPVFGDLEDQVTALAAIFRLFARALARADHRYRGVNLRFAANLVEKEQFQADPWLLDSIEPLEDCYMNKEEIEPAKSYSSSWF